MLQHRKGGSNCWKRLGAGMRNGGVPSVRGRGKQLMLYSSAGGAAAGLRQQLPMGRSPCSVADMHKRPHADELPSATGSALQAGHSGGQGCALHSFSRISKPQCGAHPAASISLVSTMPHPPAHIELHTLCLSRYVDDGKMKTDYPIIIGGQNFGCGSSREHAPVALGAAGERFCCQCGAAARGFAFAPLHSTASAAMLQGIE